MYSSYKMLFMKPTSSFIGEVSRFELPILGPFFFLFPTDLVIIWHSIFLGYE
jgi:hypothetical protein